MKLSEAQLRNIIRQTLVSEASQDRFSRSYNELVDILTVMQDKHGMDPERIAIQAAKTVKAYGSKKTGQ